MEAESADGFLPARNTRFYLSESCQINSDYKFPGNSKMPWGEGPETDVLVERSDLRGKILLHI